MSTKRGCRNMSDLVRCRIFFSLPAKASKKIGKGRRMKTFRRLFSVAPLSYFLRTFCNTPFLLIPYKQSHPLEI